MLTSITIDAATDLQIPIVGSTIADKYIVKSIDGLGPPDINVVIEDLATDGGIYQNRRSPSRNPVLTLGLNPDYSQNQTVDDLRDALYLATLEPGGDAPMVTVMLHDSAKPDRTFVGVVNSLEAAPFTKDPEVQVSFLCPSPFLAGAAASVVPSTPNTIEEYNPGTASCGFHMLITFTADTAGFTLSRGPAQLLALDYAFLVGDVLEINTTPGQRLIRRQRAGTWLNIIDSFSGSWPRLIPGDNTITLSTSNVTWTSLDYTPLWWGV